MTEVWDFRIQGVQKKKLKVQTKKKNHIQVERDYITIYIKNAVIMSLLTQCTALLMPTSTLYIDCKTERWGDGGETYHANC